MDKCSGGVDPVFGLGCFEAQALSTIKLFHADLTCSYITHKRFIKFSKRYISLLLELRSRENFVEMKEAGKDEERDGKHRTSLGVKLASGAIAGVIGTLIIYPYVSFSLNCCSGWI